MKLFFWKYCLVIVAILGINSCLVPDFEMPETSTSYILKKAEITSYNSRKISFFLDVFVLDQIEEGIISEITEIPDTCFKLLNYVNGNVHYTYRVNSIEYVKETQTEDFETLLLIDNSFYTKGGLFNSVIESMNGFTRKIPTSSRYALSYFSRDGNLKSNFEIDQDSFCSFWNQEASKRMYRKCINLKGTSAFFDALYQAIDFMDSFVISNNKSITVFAVNKDDGKSTHTLDEVIESAVNKNIKINIICLSTNLSEDWNSIYQIPSETGGLGICGFEWDLSTTFLALNKLLRNEYGYYRVNAEVSISPSPPNIIQRPYFGWLGCNFSEYSTAWNYFYFSLNNH